VCDQTLFIWSCDHIRIPPIFFIYSIDNSMLTCVLKSLYTLLIGTRDTRYSSIHMAIMPQTLYLLSICMIHQNSPSLHYISLSNDDSIVVKTIWWWLWGRHGGIVRTTSWWWCFRARWQLTRQSNCPCYCIEITKVYPVSQKCVRISFFLFKSMKHQTHSWIYIYIFFNINKCHWDTC